MARSSFVTLFFPAEFLSPFGQPLDGLHSVDPRSPESQIAITWLPAAFSGPEVTLDGNTLSFGSKVLLLELYGDDSLPVRIVVDEPLTPDEEAQWLARASWRIDTSDGRMFVMGGFDPDVLIRRTMADRRGR